MFFSSRTTDDSSEEEDIISKRKVKSPHVLNSYISFTRSEDSVDCLNKVLSTNFDDKDVSKFVPWHVTESCNIIANMDLPASRSDLTVDC